MNFDIKKILDEIDGLREKATQGEWKFEEHGIDYGFVGDDGRGTVLYGENCEGAVDKDDKDAVYLVALHNSYPTLRDYIISLGRESESGEDVK